jgi:ribosomal protein L16 Arg81 hydroxylase
MLSIARDTLEGLLRPLSYDRFFEEFVGKGMLHLPRGTAHTVQSTTESIHLSIGFLPVTVREAMAAAVDYLSESDRSIRAVRVGDIPGALGDDVKAALVGRLVMSGFLEPASQ